MYINKEQRLGWGWVGVGVGVGVGLGSSFFISSVK